MDLKSLTSNENDSSIVFVRNLILAVIIGLVIGGLIDNFCILIQEQIYGDTDLTKIQQGFMVLIQTLLIVLFFLLAVKIFNHFVPWIQLTMSGMMFSVAVFIVQDNLVKNCISLIKFF